MSLGARALQYYRNHILFHCKISPAPTTAAEVQHLYENLKSLGNLEYFRVPRNNGIDRFSQNCYALFNPERDTNLTTPFTTVPVPLPLLAEAQARQHSLVDLLRSIVALPRYSYVEHNQRYWDGHNEIPFKWSVGQHGLGNWETKLSVSASRSGDLFCYASPVDHHPEHIEKLSEDDKAAHKLRQLQSIDTFRNEIRHNFQKFHKFSGLRIETGPLAVNSLSSSGLMVSDAFEEVGDVLNLDP